MIYIPNTSDYSASTTVSVPFGRHRVWLFGDAGIPAEAPSSNVRILPHPRVFHRWF